MSGFCLFVCSMCVCGGGGGVLGLFNARVLLYVCIVLLRRIDSEYCFFL